MSFNAKLIDDVVCIQFSWGPLMIQQPLQKEQLMVQQQKIYLLKLINQQQLCAVTGMYIGRLDGPMYISYYQIIFFTF